jgi:hypothetical protein
LFGNVVAGEVHPQPHIPVFGNRKKKIIFFGRIHQFLLPCHKFGEAAFRGDFPINSMAPLFSNSGACVVIFQLTVEPVNSGVMFHCNTVH